MESTSQTDWFVHRKRGFLEKSLSLRVPFEAGFWKEKIMRYLTEFELQWFASKFLRETEYLLAA